MGVVQNDLVRGLGIQHFHPAGHVDHAFQSLPDSLLINAEDHGQRRGGQRIVHVEHARQVHMHRHFFQSAQQNGEGHAVLGNFNIPGKHIRVGADAEGQIGHLDVLDDLIAGLIVGIQCGVEHLSMHEEALLGLEVVLHGAEIIQMVLRQVSVARRLEGHAVQPVHGYGMGADLHADHFHALVPHLPQAAVQVDGIRGGQIAVQPLFADHIAGGADQAGLEARLFQNGLHQVAGGGLALGAAHAHHTDFFFRVAVEGRGDIGHGGTDVFHLYLRHVRIQNALHHKGDAAVFLRLTHESVSVKARAADAEEQTAGGLLPAVGDQGVYADFHIPLRFQNSGYVHQQILQ